MAESLTPWDAPLIEKRTPDQKWMDENFTPEQIAAMTTNPRRPTVDDELERLKREIDEQHAAMMNGKRWVPGKPIEEYAKPKKWQFWRRIKSPLPFPLFSWSEGPFIYAFYLLLIAFQVLSLMNDPKADNLLEAGSIGFNIGSIFWIFMHRLEEKSRKLGRKISDELKEMEIEFRVRAEYDARARRNGQRP